MRNIIKTQEKDFEELLKEELESYQTQGVSLYLEGRLSTPGMIANACHVAEGGGYMRDYTEDKYGKIASVNFDFVRGNL